jgi:hypothetical protein
MFQEKPLSGLRQFVVAAMLSVFLMVPAAPSVAQAVKKSVVNNNQQVIMGWVEYVYLQDLNGRLKAKLDTGATTSSMRAEVLKVLNEHDEQKRSVLFQIVDAEGNTKTIQRKLVRWVRIKGKSGKFQRRPVVEMDFCIAGHPVHSEVNLAPRADFVYPILVGRNMLRSANIIVDPARTFTAHARCPEIGDND